MNERILNTILKTGVYLEQYKNVCVSVSGGSDSDIIVDIVERFKTPGTNIYYIFANTGLEYQATKDHLKYLENRYNIVINEIRGEPIPLVIKKYGFPIISKEKSKNINAYMRGVQYAIDKYNKTGSYSRPEKRQYCFTQQMKYVTQYCIENNLSVSARCCDLSKKLPIRRYQRSVNCDLTITGERKAEGGIRAKAHKSCFEETNSHNGCAKFMPLFFWSDSDKLSYKIDNNIVYSDCYEKYGLSRTGCCGCPFNPHLFQELEIIKTFEPKLYNACWGVFGKSYEITELFNIRKSDNFSGQLSFF